MARRRRSAPSPAAPPVEPAASPLEALPDSVLTSILLTLPLDERLRISAVSRRFAAFLRTPEPLAVLDFAGLRCRGRCDNSALARLCRYAGAALRVLDLAGAPAAGRVTPGGLALALGACPGLRRLVTWRAPSGGDEDAPESGAPTDVGGVALNIIDAALLHAFCPLLGPDSTLAVVCSPATVVRALLACPGPTLHLTVVGGNASERSLPADAQKFAAAADAAAGLQVFAAPHIELGDGGAAQLAAALVAAPGLRRLELNRNRLSNAGAAALGQISLSSLAAGRSPGLRALTLRHNTIGDAGVMALALSALRTLHLLDLQDNGVGPAGAIALANALERGSPLRHLDLRRNRVTAHGGRALLAAIGPAGQGETQLRLLNLAHNHMGAASGESLAREAVAVFKHGDARLRLRTLVLTGNGVEAATLKDLDAACTAHWLRQAGETEDSSWEA